MQSLASSLPGHDLTFSGVGDLQLWLADPSTPPADPATDVVLVHADGDTLVPPLGRRFGVDARADRAVRSDPSVDRGHRHLAPRRTTHRIVLRRRARYRRAR